MIALLSFCGEYPVFVVLFPVICCFLFFHSCITGTDVKHENEIDLFEAIDENVSYIRCPYHCFIIV